MAGDKLPELALRREATEKGQRLGLLISSLDIPQEQKEAMLTLLPEMNEGQIDKFIAALEENYLKQATAGADKELEAGLKVAQEEYEEKMNAAKAEADKRMKEIQDKLS